MQTKAVFIGQDGSMGLRTGREYEFDIIIDKRYIWICLDNGLGGKNIPYQTMKGLLRNWNF